MTSSLTLPKSLSDARKPLMLLSLVFFLWGCLTGMNSILIPFFYQYFALTYQQSMLVNVAFYLAPFLGCLPCSALMAQLGYRKTLNIAVLLAALGCGITALALGLYLFWLTLVGVFILATGVATMQVVANPYVARLGSPTQAAGRLSLASAINSSGTTLAPLMVASLLMVFPVDMLTHSEPVKWFYLALAAISVLLVGLFHRSRLPDFQQQATQRLGENCRALWQQPQFVLGVFGIFLYVGAEVSIGTTAFSYLSSPQLAGFPAPSATSLIALYWGGSLAGRIIYGLGANKIDSLKIFCLATLCAGALVLSAVLLANRWGGFCLLLVGLMNSLMYPVIFAHSVRGLGDKTSLASAFLIMAGVGGGVIPFLQGSLIDAIGLRWSFLLPVAAYLLLMLGSLTMRRYSPRQE